MQRLQGNSEGSWASGIPFRWVYVVWVHGIGMFGSVAATRLHPIMKTPRTTRSSTARSLRVIGSTLGAILLPASVSAALSVYEPFNYTAAANLSTQNGGTGFSGAWANVSPTATIAASGLTYSGLTVVGYAASTAAASAVSQNRGLTTTLGASGTTTFFSFLYNPSAAVTSRNGEFGLIGAANLYVGRSSTTDTSHYVLETGAAGSGSGQQATTVTATAGTTVLMVLRADFLAGNDTFKLYINPSNVAEPSTAAATLGSIDLGASLSTIQINGNLGFSVDELKIGSSYADVVPEASTWGSVIAVIGVGCIAWLKHRTVQRAAKATVAIPAPVAR